MFKPSKEIVSKDGVVHFRRWVILQTPWFSILLHQILQPDKDPHLHNHPWNLRSLVLRGCYVERMQDRYNGIVMNIRGPWNYAYRNATKDFHKIDAVIEPTWTINLVGKPLNAKWGYTTSEGFIEHDEYRVRKHNNTLPKGE